ncbi:MAG: NAD(P)/FAD-dependent oxidoreductase [Anaerolineae bacterium]|nr:NAD(P)/FAD-dependent oxidoreductase [Anaerolineae bacterium]
MTDHNYDIIIIGAGIIGSLIARDLSRYQLRILLLEKESDVGTVTTAANTAIIHGGYDPVPGSLKASMNVAGNAMWDTLAGELNFAFDRCGDYVIGIGPEEHARLDELLDMGQQNGVPGLSIISSEEMRRREPSINPLVSGAMHAPTAGICDPFDVTIAAAENALMNGVDLMLETAFEDFVIRHGHIIAVKTNRGTFGCRWVINSAGLYADQVMHRAGVRPDFHITPRRGEYMIMDKADVDIRNVMFPVPAKHSKGILVSTTTHGNTIVGPSNHDVADKEDKAVTRAGLDEIWRGAEKLVPSLQRRHIIASFAGLRATGNAPCLAPGVNYNHDFIIEIATEVRGLVNLGGIESPGLSSAPAIARRVVELLDDAGEPLKERQAWNPIRPARPRFRDLSPSRRERLVAEKPLYGRIVCRCETVMEGEIVAEIHAPIPATTYDAIKRRTWLGTGRCQGGFDMPRVVEILARELDRSPLEVTKQGPGSVLLSRPTKEVEV